VKKKQTINHPLLKKTWLYDTIMEAIEPDLTTENFKKLGKKYKGESREDKAARGRRYDEAFRMFDEILAGINDHFMSDVREKKSLVREKLQREEEEERSQEIESIEQEFGTLDPSL